MTRVMMVCLGNICRSPMAAAVLDNKAQEREVSIRVSSSGTASYHVGEGPNQMSLRVWSDAGYRYSHVAQQFKSHMFDTNDLILVMDDSNRANVLRLARNDSDRVKVHYLRSFDPELTNVSVDGQDYRKLIVPDPWERPRAEFEKVLNMIERSVDGLLDNLARQS